MDLFRCESAMLRTHSVLVVMDQYTRWCRTLSDVQPRHSRATPDAQLPQLR